MSADQLRRNLRRIHAAFAAAWDGPVRLLPAFKANPTLALRRLLDAEGAGCDAFGPWELEAALRAGTPPERISFNGPAKDDAVLAPRGPGRCARDRGLARRAGAARRRGAGLGRRALVRLRLRPHTPELTMPSDLLDAPVPVADVVLAYKPGIPGDQVAAAGALIARAEGLDALGVHMHFPRHVADPGATRGRAARVRGADRGAERRRRRLAPAGDRHRRRLPAAARPGRPRARPPRGRAARAADRGVRRASSAPSWPRAPAPCSRSSPVARCSATRACTSRACSASSAQTAPEPYTWIETDTSEAFLPDGLLEYNRWTVLAAGRLDEPAALRGDVVGRSCGFDVLTANADLPALEPGDLLAILDTGAYQDAASSNFNVMPRPATVLVSGDRHELARRRETPADVFARDVGGTARLDHCGVTVADLDRSLRFYHGLLGLPVRAQGEDDGAHLEAITGLTGARVRFADLDAGGGRVVELLQYLEPVAESAAAAPNAPGSGHVAIEVTDVAAAAERLRAAGATLRSRGPVAIEDDGDWAGVTCLYAVDPDGFTVELLQR